ncbi:MAG: hypothetical protein NTZ03_14105 [Actinobacteria bacterium]|nr:hypothetical protein [Actinomycetota bacterium]
MGGDAAPFNVLVVCSANVCRSPVAAALLESSLAPQVTAGLIAVTSRGVWANDGDAVCGRAVQQAGLGSLQHSAQRLTAADIAGADLILTAEQVHRASVVEKDLSARKRTFTLREAAALSKWFAAGSPVPEGLEVPPPPPTPADPHAQLLWWVSELNAGRGIASMGSGQDLDIADAHGEVRVDHAAVMAAVGSAVAGIARDPAIVGG